MIDQSAEAERCRMLRSLALLDSAPEAEFDALAETAKRMFGTKIALLSLIDRNRQWFKARSGLDLTETSRETSFCAQAVEADAALVVKDTLLDPVFATSPLVLGEPNIRFYAGVPVRVRQAGGDGAVPIGSLCVIDDAARDFTEADLGSLQALARIAEALIEARALALRSAALAESRRDSLERLERERRQLKQAERMADMGSWRLTIADGVAEWSEGVFAIHELPAGSMPPLETALEFYPEADRQRVSDALTQAIETGQPFDIESDFITARGKPRRVRSMGEVEISHGAPVAIIGLFQDITERYRMEQALVRTSRTDELTRLPNRGEFNRILGEKLLEAESTRREVAVLLVDLDGFKQVNDLLGHAAGDDILRKVGERLRASWLPDCFAARLGGDEFAIIVPSLEHRDAFKGLVDRLLASLRLTAQEAGTRAAVSATIGIAWSQGMRLPREELLRRADAALYAAKRALKGSAQTFSQSFGS
ncbi:hypothetical protein ASG43_19490 [Aureimonas sp. Leaf454]|uniref:diguanylate cyclase domain-containing protein n=1 Tax=Aureimonas sp. Leaf454 TaxID=1736381 RepID=UPI000701ED82|nr:diguanylate cyclase [Aureimonas sp. Leaf454]KQT53161.1 hypothetical protein ASG43_19490 [Aureimonas sp. Leaf454]